MITIEIDDKQDFIGKIRNAETSLEREVEDALKSSMFLLLRESKIRTPVDLGGLINSYRMDVFSDGASLYPTVNYAVYVHNREFTKSGKKIYHKVGEALFMKKALDVSIDKIHDYFLQAVKRVL